MAQDFVSWHFGVEDLVTEALDMDSIGRSTRVGTHQVLSSLDHYLGEPPYPVERDIDLVECSCRADILATLRAASLPSSLGIQVNKWRANEATSSLRLPVLLSLGACCSAYSPREPCNSTELERFIAAFKELVQANGVDYDADPKPIEERLICDKTLDRDVEEMAHPIDSLGPVRHTSLLLDTSAFLPGGTRLRVRSGLIVVSRIALLKPTTERPFHKPHVMTLILANGYGRPDRHLRQWSPGRHHAGRSDRLQRTANDSSGDATAAPAATWPPTTSWSGSTWAGRSQRSNWSSRLPAWWTWGRRTRSRCGAATWPRSSPAGRIRWWSISSTRTTADCLRSSSKAASSCARPAPTTRCEKPTTPPPSGELLQRRSQT